MGNGSGNGAVFERARTTRALEDPGAFFSSDGADAPLVMVIDDSPAVRRVVEISLLRAGIPAVAYPGGLAALGALQIGEVVPPRVLLLDIGMPRMNGYEVARLIKSNPECAETCVIMLSGHDGVVNRTLSRMYGASDFIAKPFKAAELVRRVRRALGVIDPDAGWPS